MSVSRLLCLMFVLVSPLLLTACGRSNNSNVVTITAHDEPAMRIVSLAPALTRMLIDLHLGDTLVGVGEHDAAAPKGTPVVGAYDQVDSEKLIALHPDYIFTLADASGVPANLKSLALAHGYHLVVYPYPNSVEDVSNILFDERELVPGAESGPDDTAPRVSSLGTMLDVRAAAMRLRVLMLRQMTAVHEVVQSAGRPKVLLLIGTHPLMASGPGTVLNNVLASYAGGTNAAAGAKTTAVTYDREKLLAIDPQVIVLLAPGAQPLKSLTADPRLGELVNLDIPAVKNHRVVAITDPLVLLPSSNLAHVTAELAKAIHPDLAAKIDAAMKAAAHISATSYQHGEKSPAAPAPTHNPLIDRATATAPGPTSSTAPTSAAPAPDKPDAQP